MDEVQCNYLEENNKQTNEQTKKQCNPSGCSNGQHEPSTQLIWAPSPPAGFYQAAARANFKEIRASNDAHLAQSQQLCIA